MADKLSYLKAGMAVKACRIIISFCGEKIYARGLRCEMHHKFADTAALKLFLTAMPMISAVSSEIFSSVMIPANCPLWRQANMEHSCFAAISVISC